MITNADVPLLRGLLCYLLPGRSTYYEGFYIYLHHGAAVICKLFLVNLLHVMHGLMSTYNYLISSCAYPGWAWHNVNYGCTSKNRVVNPCLSLLLYLLLACFRCSGAWLSLAVTSLICCSYLAFLTTRLQVDYPRTASVIHKY